MKKIFAITLCAALVLSLIALAACSNGGSEPTEEANIVDNEPGKATVGGYQRTASPVVTDEVKTLLEKALMNLDGADYIPVAYVATQVVAGTNHLILCKTAPVVPDAGYTYALVTVYEDLEGNAEITEVLNSEAEAPADENLMGGWSEPESPEMTKEAQAALDKLTETLTGATFDPIALLGTQVVAGTNYCLLCEETATVPDAEPFYTIVQIYSDLEGKAELTATYEFSKK